jgi:site-specific DNA-methyltransferase (adenine-specific)
MKITSIIDKIEKHIISSTPKITKYGEVFTPTILAEEMLDLLPIEFWSNQKLKILDPCNGIGNFPSVIIKKLMDGLVEFEPDEEKRYKHIIENIIYVCEIQPRNISHFLNLFNVDNKFNLNYYEGSYLEEEFDSHKNNVWKINNFNLIIGNPPYQSGLSARASVSIYHKFVIKSVSISTMVLMITPSKWYSNPSMSKFRNNMINNYGLKKLIDANDVFKNVEIKGGVSYFLLEKGFTGECLYNNTTRVFKNDIITNKNYDDIISKLSKHNNFKQHLKSDQYFGIRNVDNRFLNKMESDCVTCYVSSRNGNIKYIKKDNLDIKSNYNKYKVMLPTASGSKTNIGTLGRIIIAKPTEVCSRSFVHFAFDTLEECESFISYINTDIIKTLISIKKQTQLVKKDCFSLVPIVPLDRIWTNNEVNEFLDIH